VRSYVREIYSRARDRDHEKLQLLELVRMRSRVFEFTAAIDWTRTLRFDCCLNSSRRKSAAKELIILRVGGCEQPHAFTYLHLPSYFTSLNGLSCIRLGILFLTTSTWSKSISAVTNASDTSPPASARISPQGERIIE
jgi:hypothetical protein